MPRFELTLRKNGEDVSRFQVGSKAIIIGRAADADIVLPDNVISRQHARLQVIKDYLLVEDLGSTNRIAVNGELVKHQMLRSGDEILFGKYTALVDMVVDEEAELQETGIFIPYEATDTIIRKMVESEGSSRLNTLYEAAQLLGKRLELDELLGRILDLVFDAIPTNRGFILTRPSESLPPEVRASRSTSSAAEELPLSRTMIEYVFEHRTSILTPDAMTDRRFANSKSIISHHIHSAMCAPLWGQNRIVGAIYIDAPAKAKSFSQGDLELLTAIGRVVGVAVENIWLNETAMRNERLAAIGEAIASIGHTMKNIMAGLKAGEEFLESGISERKWQYTEFGWNSLHGSLGRFEALVIDLLNFSKDMQLDCRNTPLEPLLNDLFNVVQAKAEKVNVTLIFPKEDLGSIYCDQDQIFRALLNIVGNAIEACEPKAGGTVELTTWLDPAGCYVTVRDDGVGIPKEHLGRISQAFFTTKRSKGTGLGLTGSQRIIEAHGGRLAIESTEGQGSTFTMFLPHEPIDPDALDTPIEGV